MASLNGSIVLGSGSGNVKAAFDSWASAA